MTPDHARAFSSGPRQWHVHAGGKALRVSTGLQPPAPERTCAPVSLPASARVYVGVVCAAGAAALLAAATTGAATTQPLALAVLLATSLVASVAKVEIAVVGSGATLTACHAVDLLALLLCGPDAAVIVSAWGGWTQCTFRSRRANPLHQTAFSVAALALAMMAAGFVYTTFGGPGGDWSALKLEPFAAAGTVFFLVNTALVAAAVSLSVGEPYRRVWFDFFLSVWPSYLIGAGISAVLAQGLRGQNYWLVPLLAASLLMLHRNYRSCLARMNDGITDPLTGLPNKRFVVDYVERELTRARRRGTRLAIALFDMNSFKQINDVNGHAVGDRALRKVAERLRESMRGTDLCARYGGDEFLVVMPDQGSTGAIQRIQAMQAAVRTSADDSEFGTTLSVSAGIAVFPEDGTHFDALFAKADASMYDNKMERVTRIVWGNV